ncbi:MaoC family dehydratase [Sphingomonas sp. TF3]|uniref:MaoC family dehydratase n=1 Tax=Sphingomonas sp. TF3 TaxID=2495580 RepID=UPI000F8957FC|nr:MaoC family dehydratase [Sphingomonas sp. TF3]RUN78382.1 MaoC family dehydratase [Sphingomonas sp. TF3]
MTTLFSRESLPGLVGKTLGPGEWVEVTQERIDEFASASGDRQWIHVDVERARTGPFGTTIAHGLLTLSMIADLNKGMFKFDGFKMGLNYGYEKVRFPSTVPVGSRLRVTAKVLSFEPVGQMFQTIVEYTVEREGADKPACVAQMIFRHVP